MWIGAAKISLDFFGNNNIKLKKKNMLDLCKDIKKTFNVSASEIDSFDDPEKCSLGVSIAMPSDWNDQKAKETIQNICSYIDNHSFTRVISDSWEVYYLE